MRIILLLGLGLWFLGGCSSYRTINVPVDNGEWTEGNVPEQQPQRMYTQREEGKYVIKPEPYSLKSKKKDPELLGPQRTYRHTENTTNAQTNQRKRHKGSAATMTKASCITLIGEEKFNSYVQKYGSEAKALRRCLIIKRLRG